MKIDDLVKLLGKTRIEVEEMLAKQEVIELNLSERRQRREENDDLRIYE